MAGNAGALACYAGSSGVTDWSASILLANAGSAGVTVIGIPQRE